LEELFKFGTSKKITLNLLELMCKFTTAPKNVKEEELLHKRKEVEVALLVFQRYFFQ